MTTSTQDGSHRRSATRAPVGRPIKLQFDDSMEVIEGLCRNVSIGGMFISFDDSRPAGSLVRFELEIEGGGAIRGLGEVVWMRSKNEFGGPESGFGLKFRFLEQRDRQLIFKLVSQHIKDRLSKREPAEGAAAEPVSELQAPAAEVLGIAVPPDPSPPTASPPTASPPTASPPTASPPALSAEALGVAVPPETSPPPSPAPAEEELPFELPPAAPSPAVSPPPASPPTASPPAAASPPTASPEPLMVADELLPALEETVTDDLDPTIVGSRPAGLDPIDLDPSVGQTPMYELGLESEPPPSAKPPVDDFELPAEPTVPLADAGGGIAAVSGNLEQADLREERQEEIAAPAPRPRRQFAVLPVIGIVLLTAGAGAYLFKDELMTKLGLDEPQIVVGPGVGDARPDAGGDPPTEPDAESGSVAATAGAPPTPALPPPKPAPPPPPKPAPPSPRPSPPVAQAGAVLTRLTDVTWGEVPGGIKVTLKADGSIPAGRYKYFRIDGAEPREVVKLMGLDRGYPQSQITVGGPGLRQIRFGFHRKAGGNELHVVLDLAGQGWRLTEVKEVGSTLELTLAGR